MTLARSEFDRVSRLAGLRIEERETAQLCDDLGKILEFACILDTLDDAGTDPRFVAAGDCPVRDDAPKQSLKHDETLRNAPAAEDGWFTVGMTVTRDSEAGST